jgi:hypothetical protein
MFDIFNRRRVAELERRLGFATYQRNLWIDEADRLSIKLRGIERQRRAAAAKGRASQAAKRLAKLHQHNADMRASMEGQG